MDKKSIAMDVATIGLAIGTIAATATGLTEVSTIGALIIFWSENSRLRKKVKELESKKEGGDI